MPACLPTPEYTPGEMGECDWSTYTLPFTTGRRVVQIFLLVPVVSRRKCFSRHASLDVHALMDGHVQAFTRMGGVLRRIKYDNQKTVVLWREGGQQVRTWDVGRRVAAQLREAVGSAFESSESSEDAEVHRARPRPHTRRAHEHRYWMRDDDGEKVLVSRWVGLVNVNTKSADDLIETVRQIPDEGAAPASDKIRMH